MKRREFLTIPAAALGGTLLYTLSREPLRLQAQTGGKDGMVKLWSVRTKAAKEHQLDYNSFPIWFSSDSKTLLTRSGNGSLHFWDVETGRHRRAIPA